MSGRSSLEEAFPEAICEIHPDDAQQYDVSTGDWIALTSRRGTIEMRALVTGRSPRGTIFIPFHFAEAAANKLTLVQIDSRAKIPDFKNTAVRIAKTAVPEGWDEGYKEPLLERGTIKDPLQIH